MKRLSLVAFSALVIGILACGGGGDADVGEEEDEALSVDLPSVPITEPWKSMNLPTSSGQVVMSDEKSILVAYDDATINGLASDYGSALTSGGWQKGEDYSTADFIAIVYNKATQQVGLATGMDSGLTFAYLEDLSKVSDDESAVKSAKKGRSGVKRGKINRTKRSGGGSKKSSGRGGSGKKGGKKGKKGN